MRCLMLLAAVAVLYASPVNGAPGPFPNDGWYTWSTEAVEDMPAWCCYSWQGGSAIAKPCELDNNRNHGISIHNDANTTDTLQLYVRMSDGKADRIRTLSPHCPVRSPTDITDFGAVNNDESLKWLKDYIGAGPGIGDDAMASIAAHESRVATEILTRTAESNPQNKLRKDAIFWMGQLRIAETFDTVVRFMNTDESADVRGHAAFSLSQSGAAGSREAIMKQMQNDSHRHVRDQAVFALSQLPDDEGVDSLLAIVRDRGQQQHLREKALFWLAESDSDRAYAEIERLLAE